MVTSLLISAAQESIIVLMKIQSWNVRGIGRPEKRRKIKKSLAERKVDIALLQETKKAAVGSEVVRTMWPGDKFDFMAVDAVGRSGGLLCIWNPDVFQLKACCSNQNFILLSGTGSMPPPKT
ncbi:hypothetical protein ACSBR1_013171 [Camellia fascicularis]